MTESPVEINFSFDENESSHPTALRFGAHKCPITEHRDYQSSHAHLVHLGKKLFSGLGEQRIRAQEIVADGDYICIL